MKVSVALAIENKDGVRCKTGDVICVRPVGWKWGTEEIKRFLIVEVDLGTNISTVEDARKLEVPHFETGEVWYPSSDLPQPKIIGKRRYNINFSELDGLARARGVIVDFTKLNDLNVAYQPLEKVSLPVSNLIKDKFTNKKVTPVELAVIRNYGK